MMLRRWCRARVTLLTAVAVFIVLGVDLFVLSPLPKPTMRPLPLITSFLSASEKAALVADVARTGHLFSVSSGALRQESCEMRATEFERSTSFIVKAMDRPESLIRLLRSIRRAWPCAPVLVGDDGSQPLGESRALAEGASRYLLLPYDSGLSATRNALVDSVRTPYFLLCDDDFEFAGRADPAVLVSVLRDNLADIVCGGLYLPVPGTPHHELASTTAATTAATTATTASKPSRLQTASTDYYYAGIFTWSNETSAITSAESKLVQRTLTLRDGTLGPVPKVHQVKEEEHPCEFVDIGINFFAGRTEAVRRVRWDNQLKLAEHEDFFLRAKACVTIYCKPQWIDTADSGCYKDIPLFIHNLDCNVYLAL